jgi:hypothetical protein
MAHIIVDGQHERVNHQRLCPHLTLWLVRHDVAIPMCALVVFPHGRLTHVDRLTAMVESCEVHLNRVRLGSQHKYARLTMVQRSRQMDMSEGRAVNHPCHAMEGVSIFGTDNAAS